MGSSESHTRLETLCCSTSAESTHAYTGPADLTTCAKETEPAAVPTVPAMCPMAWKEPIGRRVQQAARDSLGGERNPVAQSKTTKMLPTTTVAAATTHGSGSKLVTCLFVTE